MRRLPGQAAVEVVVPAGTVATAALVALAVMTRTHRVVVEVGPQP
jgi:hypothetical protein